jgi:hypothetical protein
MGAARVADRILLIGHFQKKSQYSFRCSFIYSRFITEVEVVSLLFL